MNSDLSSLYVQVEAQPDAKLDFLVKLHARRFPVTCQQERDLDAHIHNQCWCGRMQRRSRGNAPKDAPTAWGFLDIYPLGGDARGRSSHIWRLTQTR
ncbi:hypothetical protein BKA70DRAFT_1571644 [Coprinopsis sp. MPI-PUGE-AT-0042]|nr:hypothetical protein BKA70DRAFT_1571644 [Coprinopsis sp. MPI-PUGE-AT-0042]